MQVQLENLIRNRLACIAFLLVKAHYFFGLAFFFYGKYQEVFYIDVLPLSLSYILYTLSSLYVFSFLLNNIFFG